jgi:hypothetical protein
MRISLRVVFVLMAIVCGFLALEFGLPPRFLDQANMILWIVTPSVLCAVIVYGEGDARAFAAGAILPHALLCYACTTGSIEQIRDMMEFNAPLRKYEAYRLISFVGWAGSLTLGVIWMVTRKVFSKDSSSQGEP